MLLAIDIGNTNITFGIFKGKKLLKTWKAPTNKFKGININKNINSIIICSVVPKALMKLKKSLKSFRGRVFVVGENIKAPIKNLYRKPKQVGQDRLVDAVAAFEKFKRGCIVVDFGTAITFDLISNKGDYLGGIIVPGIELSLKALKEGTALLPRVSLTKPKELLGKDTKSSIQSGMGYGFGFLCDGIITDLKKRVRRGWKGIERVRRGIPVIATGGAAGIFKKICKEINKIDPHLTLKGLEIIYNSVKI